MIFNFHALFKLFGKFASEPNYQSNFCKCIMLFVTEIGISREFNSNLFCKRFGESQIIIKS